MKRRYKMIILGDAGVGKTTLVKRYFNSTGVVGQDSCYCPTVGLAVSCMAGADYMLEVWDTAGQERYRSMPQRYFNEASIFMIVYDVTDYRSFVRARDIWLKDIREHTNDLTDKIIILVGTKFDLTNGQSTMQPEAEILCARDGILHRETSGREDYQPSLTDMVITQLENIKPLVSSVTMGIKLESEPVSLGRCWPFSCYM